MTTRVLVIDDEPSIRVLVRMVLEEDGYTVLEAASGEKGLDVAEQERPHLVLLDIRLPGIDGWEVLRRLRDREPPPVVVMMSAHSSEPTLRRAEREGSRGYLIKPFRHVELLEIVAAGTARSRP